MKSLKRVNLFVLISFFLSSVSVAPTFAMQTGRANTVSLEDMGNFIKNIFTLDYLNGEHGEHRNSSLIEKVTSHPDRALTTLAAYGLALFAAKKVYDFVDKAGVFDEVIASQPRRVARPQVRVVPAPVPDQHDHDVDYDENDENRAPIQRPQPRSQIKNPVHNNKPSRGNKKRSKNKKRRPENRPVQNPIARPVQNPVNRQPVNNPADRPVAAERHNNVRLANPLPGRQLDLLPRLPGFYHMHSQTPYQGYQGSCGVQAAFNMALVEEHMTGRRITGQAFTAAQREVLPDPGKGGRGASNVEVVRLARRAGLAPVTVLHIRNNAIITLGRDGGNVARIAQDFHRTNGPRVAHFLCSVPGHWIAVSVARNGAGEMAMYLYDNLNHHARSIPEMRRHVENIYNRFF